MMVESFTEVLHGRRPASATSILQSGLLRQTAGRNSMNSLIIGIAGGSGSGKTTLALRLKARFGEEEVRLIPHDSYYKRHDDLPYEKRCLLNYDHPDAFDNQLLVHHLQELKAGRGVDCPVYDYAIHNRSDQVRHIEPAPVLIVEGILPFVDFAGRQGARALSGQRHHPVPHHRQTHARSFCGTQQAQRRHHRAQRRRKRPRPGNAGAPHPQPDPAGTDFITAPWTEPSKKGCKNTLS